MSIIKQPSAKKSNTNIIFEYLEKFPNAPSKTLARKVYSEQSAFFETFEHAYSRIRYYRGQKGSHLRKKLSNKNKN